MLDLVEIPRRPVGTHDVHIKVEYCGVCHSDLHTVRGEWGPVKFPCVPGHEGKYILAIYVLINIPPFHFSI